jgi:hypothetical protein
MAEDLGRRGQAADVEGTELGVAGTGLVETHAIDDVLEELGVAGPEVIYIDGSEDHGPLAGPSCSWKGA